MTTPGLPPGAGVRLPGRGADRGAGSRIRGEDAGRGAGSRRPGGGRLVALFGRRWPLLVAALLVVAAAHLYLIAQGFTTTRLWEDEAYNLSVPVNLVHGHGYASDGLLTYTAGRVPFDVRISTGPNVLLPIAALLATGVGPLVAGRLVMALFFAALLVGLWMLGRRIAGPWGGLLAVAAPLALETNSVHSPIQGPTDVLGEVPAAAFLVFALLLLRRHPLAAGLMAGFAVQAKTLAALAVPVLALAVVLAVARRRAPGAVDGDRPDAERHRSDLAMPVRPHRSAPKASPGGARARAGAGRLGRLVLLFAGGAAPLVAFQLVKLVSLGPGGFWHNTHQFVDFLRSGGQVGFDVSPLEKAREILGAWFLPWPLVLVLALAAAAVAAAGLRAAARARRDRPRLLGAALARSGGRTGARELGVLLGAALTTLILWSGWWAASTHTPGWIRYMAPVLLVAVPVLLAGILLAARLLAVLPAAAGAVAPPGRDVSRGAGLRGSESRTAEAGPGGRPRGRMLASVVVAAVALGLALAVPAGMHLGTAAVPNRGETLAEQRLVADRLSRVEGERLVTGWSSAIGAAFLSGKQLIGPPDGHSPYVTARFEASRGSFDARVRKRCDTVLLRYRGYVVCTLAG